MEFGRRKEEREGGGLPGNVVGKGDNCELSVPLTAVVKIPLHLLGLLGGERLAALTFQPELIVGGNTHRVGKHEKVWHKASPPVYVMSAVCSHYG